MNSIKSLLSRLGAIGDREGDSESERLRHRLLIYMGVLMSGGGVLWGSISASYGLFEAAVVPYGYIALTALNLLYFRASKNFAGVRAFQVLISLLLPFMFQFVLGGFADSGAVMLWAMLALVGSLTFGSSRQTIVWLAVYGLMTAIAGFIDPAVRQAFGTNLPASVQTFFLVLNIVVISFIVFGLTIYLLGERERTNEELKQANTVISQLNDGLEDLVAERTEEVARSFSRFRAMLENMADGLVAIGIDGEIQAYNPAVTRLLSLEDGPIFGRAARDTLPRELYDIAEQSIRNGEITGTDISLSGDRTAACVASPIQMGDEDETIGAVLIVRDVTLEREIDRMKTDFTAIVSHELRTPLTSVLGFAKLTQNRLEEHILPLVPTEDRKVARAVKQVRGNLEIILSEGVRLTSLISDVLDISKLESGRMEWTRRQISPAALIERATQATSSLFVGSDVELVVDVDHQLPTLWGDEGRLLQVLINLISNARKFTDAGSVTVRACVGTEGIEFAIIDTGVGIDPAHFETVFEKFRQVGDTLTDRPTGTGLGLPISQQIVVAHGGRIWVEGDLGAGSTFRFTIPKDARDSAVEAWTGERDMPEAIAKLRDQRSN